MLMFQLSDLGLRAYLQALFLAVLLKAWSPEGSYGCCDVTEKVM